MTSGNKRLAQKAVAVIVVVTLLNLVGVSPLVMMFATGVALVVWIVSRHSQARDVERVFEFYLSAYSILREEERRWYAFEIAEVIENGELGLDAIPDSPPLHLFALGALHYRIGNYAATAEYLSRVIEDERCDEGQRIAPSPQLRRYVTALRRMENEPSIAPQTLGAVKNLERMRRKQAAQLLDASRNFLKVATPDKEETVTTVLSESENGPDYASSSLNSISAPPPITEVLQDIYHDETISTQ
jgi:hypothetical protein